MTALTKRRRALNTNEVTVIDSGICGDNAFWKLYVDGTLEISGTGAIDDYYGHPPWYDYINDIHRLIIKNGITGIGHQAFAYSDTLTSADIADSVISIGDYAFANCHKLNLSELPENVGTVGMAVFQECDAITEFHFHSANLTLGPNIFQNANNIKKVYFHAQPQSLNSYCLNNSKITDIYCSWAEGAVAGAPWRANNATIHYNWTGGIA